MLHGASSLFGFLVLAIPVLQHDFLDAAGVIYLVFLYFAQILEEEVPEDVLPDVVAVLESQQVPREFLQHHVVLLPHIRRDRDAVLQVTRVRLDLVVYYYYILERAIVQQNRQVLDEHTVLENIQTLLPRKNVVKVLATFECLQHDVRVDL